MASFLFLNLLLTVVWVFLFLRDRSTRLEMVVIGATAAIFTPMFVFLNLPALPSDGLATTYAVVRVADLLFSFLFAGIAAVLFEAVFGKRVRVRMQLFSKKKGAADVWFIQLFLTVTVWAWATVFFVFVLETTALQAMVAGALFIGSYMIAVRKDLFWDAIWSALLLATVFFLLYEITYAKETIEFAHTWWLASPSGRLIGHTPLEALLWAAAIGFVLGPLYEFVRGFRLVGPKK